MEEWIKTFENSIRRYDIDRPHYTATLRVYSVDGYLRTVSNVSHDLLLTGLTAESLRLRGYKLT